MWALMVVLVFPTPQFGGELPGRAEDRLDFASMIRTCPLAWTQEGMGLKNP